VGDRLWETIKPSGFASERFKLHISPTFVRDLDMERLDDVNWFLQLVFFGHSVQGSTKGDLVIQFDGLVTGYSLRSKSIYCRPLAKGRFVNGL